MRLENKRLVFTEKQKILLCVLFILFLIGVICASLLYAENIGAALGLPSVEDASIDIKGESLDEKYTGLILKGDWEFYYNKWIITDGYEGESNGFIPVNGSWTGKELNGEKLPRSGYASYKCYITNLNEGVKFTVTLGLYSNAYRIFANGKLISESGTVSKDYGEVYASVRPEFVDFYTAENAEDIEIVVEIAQNKDGGLFFWPYLSTYERTAWEMSGNNWFGKIAPFVLFGIAIIFIFIFAALNIIRISEKLNVYLIFYVIVVLIHYSFTIDIAEMTQSLIKLDYKYFDIVACITASLFYYLFLENLQKYSVIQLSRKSLFIMAAVNLAALTGYILLKGLWVRYLFFGASAGIIIYVTFLIICQNSFGAKDFLFLIQNIIILLMFCLEAFDNNGVILVGATGVYMIAYSIILISLTAIYVLQIKELIEQSQTATALAKEIEEVKNKALKAQIKPHFIFNTLTVIQDLYHSDVQSGDAALGKFARHLRYNVDSEYNDTVSFLEELNSIQNYFDLENIRRKGKLTLLYDIDYSDFNIPILSLQPLIENAVKYAGTDEKEDGYIQVRSYKRKKDVIIEVKDNGKGFDPSEIGKGSSGISNITQRLKFSINAEVKIDSVIGEGTTVTITIPVGEGNATDNN